MKTEKTFEEAVKLDCIIKEKNSLSLSSYGLQTLVNLIFNGWTLEILLKNQQKMLTNY